MRSLFLVLLLCLPQTTEQGALPREQILPGKQAQLGEQALLEARATITRLAQKLKGVERLHANFVQEQHTLLMEEPLVSRGRMSLRGEPGCLVLELKEPKHVLLRSDATSHQVYYPAEKKAERYLFESNDLAKTLLSILTVNVAELEKAFVIVGHQRGAKEETLGLRLRDVSKRRMVDHLQILIDPKTSLLNGVSFINADGEQTVLRLTDLRYVTSESSRAERAREREVFDRPLPKNVQLVIHRVPAKGSKSSPK